MRERLGSTLNEIDEEIDQFSFVKSGITLQANEFDTQFKKQEQEFVKMVKQKE